MKVSLFTGFTVQNPVYFIITDVYTKYKNKYKHSFMYIQFDKMDGPHAEQTVEFQ